MPTTNTAQIIKLSIKDFSSKCMKRGICFLLAVQDLIFISRSLLPEISLFFPLNNICRGEKPEKCSRFREYLKDNSQRPKPIL